MHLDGAAIRAAVEAASPADGPFSGVVRVQEGDTVVFQKGYGLANRADGIPNTATTRFGMASGCKIFTAVAVLQLVQEGKLALETRLSDCLDVSFPEFDPNVTVLHLLTHTSGVPDYCDEELGDDFEALWLERPSYSMRTPRDFLPLFQNRAMKFRPGERFSYSNAGFILLGLIAEQAAGQPFTELIAARVLTPAGMADSGYFALDSLPARTAQGYIDEGDAWRTNVYALPIVGQPDGGAFTTVGDLAAFWAALRANRLLNPDLTALMLRPHIAAGREGRYYGLGVWLHRRDETVTEAFVMGSDPGVALESGVFPARDVQISVLGNTGEPTWPVYAGLRALVME